MTMGGETNGKQKLIERLIGIHDALDSCSDNTNIDFDEFTNLRQEDPLFWTTQEVALLLDLLGATGCHVYNTDEIEEITVQERVNRLGRVLKMDPSENGFNLKQITIGGKRRWWVVGGVTGDQPLPQTGTAHTEREALEAAEAWLAPEVGNDL